MTSNLPPVRRTRDTCVRSASSQRAQVFEFLHLPRFPMFQISILQTSSLRTFQTLITHTLQVQHPGSGHHVGSVHFFSVCRLGQYYSPKFQFCRAPLLANDKELRSSGATNSCSAQVVSPATCRQALPAASRS